MGVEGIILAAGLSSRAQTYKMTLKFNNKTVIENTIDNMLGFCKRIILVGGYKIENLQPIAERYENVKLVFNENYETGMFSSVLKGMSAIVEDKFFFTPGDYPSIDTAVYNELLKQEGDIIIPTFLGHKGHPLLFKSSLIKEISQGGRYSSLREFVKERNVVLVPVSCRGILTDIDTYEDYEKALFPVDNRG